MALTEQQRARRSERYHNDPEHRAYKIAHTTRIREQNAQLLDAIKLELGCYLCGFDKWAESLQFHHLGDKEFNISRNLTVSRDRLLAEVEKCVVLCANCHFRLHQLSRDRE